MRSILRSLSLPAKSTSENSQKGSISSSRIQNIHEEENETDKLSQFKHAIKYLDTTLDQYDFYYLKWLRARGYDIAKAKEMFENHLEWRESCKYLCGIMSYIPPDNILENMKWKRLGSDPVGRPIYCALIGRFNVSALSDPEFLDNCKRYAHKLLEMVQYDSDSQRKQTGYGKVIGVVDMTGLTLAKTMSISLIQTAIYFAKVFEANYPELLYRCFVLNTNWFFASIYNVIKPFLALETINKIQIYGSDQSTYLTKLESTIPNELIPEDFGGQAESVQYFDNICMGEMLSPLKN